LWGRLTGGLNVVNRQLNEKLDQSDKDSIFFKCHTSGKKSSDQGVCETAAFAVDDQTILVIQSIFTIFWSLSLHVLLGCLVPKYLCEVAGTALPSNTAYLSLFW